MSLGYSVVVELDVPLQVDIIRLILKKGASLGFIYHQFVLGKMDIDSTPLDLATAVSAVLIGDRENDLHCLLVQVEDARFILHLREVCGKITIMFSSLSHFWSKTYYANEYDLDLGHYGKVMLDLVSDFKIIKMEIEND